jgi:hypothetical protein
MADKVSYATQIKPLFTAQDISCMGGMGVKLDDYAWMSDADGGGMSNCTNFPDHMHARTVYAHLTGACQPQMPLGGSPWGKSDLDLYNQWMTDGFTA